MLSRSVSHPFLPRSLDVFGSSNGPFLRDTFEKILLTFSNEHEFSLQSLFPVSFLFFVNVKGVLVNITR